MRPTIRSLRLKQFRVYKVDAEIFELKATSPREQAVGALVSAVLSPKFPPDVIGGVQAAHPKKKDGCREKQ
jgi:hypothetical protein